MSVYIIIRKKKHKNIHIYYYNLELGTTKNVEY